MEQLIYVPFRCKIKLSWQELKSINEMLGRIEHEPGLEYRALMEWAIKKRMEYTRKLLNRKREYNFTLNAQDANQLTHALWCNFAHADLYERTIIHKITEAVDRVV